MGTTTGEANPDAAVRLPHSETIAMPYSIFPADPLKRRLVSILLSYVALNLVLAPIAYFVTNLAAPWKCFYFSVITCTTLGYNDMTETVPQQIIAVVQVLLSLYVIVIWLGYLFVKYSHPN